MADHDTTFDAVIIGAGHNGLTAALLLQRAGLRTVCLEAKRYAGGMASTVELFDGYQFEIAGSVQLPTSMIVSKELGLDTLPQVDLDVMSVSLIDEGVEPLIYYTDLGEAAAHMEQVHGIEVVIGMAEMMGWSAAPTRALGRFEAGTLPKSLDEMYACATTDAERASITEMLFGSATDVLDRYLPDKQKHAALRGMLAFLAVNSTYRGPSSPGQRGRPGVRHGGARREHRPDQEAQGRHRGAHPAPRDPVRRGRRRAAARVRGRRDRRHRRARHRHRAGRRRADRRRRRSSLPSRRT